VTPSSPPERIWPATRAATLRERLADAALRPVFWLLGIVVDGVLFLYHRQRRYRARARRRSRRAGPGPTIGS
jgi:hypothetical protein